MSTNEQDSHKLAELSERIGEIVKANMTPELEELHKSSNIDLPLGFPYMPARDPNSPNFLAVIPRNTAPNGERIPDELKEFYMKCYHEALSNQ